VSPIEFAKSVLPNHERFLPILRGPLRGGRFYANPRVSMRKVLGLYETELNPWIEKALMKADCVIDVGANDGYFTLGCAAAMRRAAKQVRITAFEPMAQHVHQIKVARAKAGYLANEIDIVPKFVGRADNGNTVTLDSIIGVAQRNELCLMKIDVEGAELDVLEGARQVLTAGSPSVVFEANENMARMGVTTADLFDGIACAAP